MPHFLHVKFDFNWNINMESINDTFLLKLFAHAISPNSSSLLYLEFSSLATMYLFFDFKFSSSCKVSNIKFKYSFASCCSWLLKVSLIFPTNIFKFFEYSSILEGFNWYNWIKADINFPLNPYSLFLLIKYFNFWFMNNCCKIGKLKKIWLMELK